jgi:MSHA biogenesis protein MshJ
MKKYWVNISTRIDALTLRERSFLFVAAAGVLIFLVFFFFLNPTYARHKSLLLTMSQQRDMIAAADAEIAQTMLAHTQDPDAVERQRLQQIKTEAQALSSALMAMQQGMVPPERMTGLLEQILRAHRSLRLTGLRTLPEDAPPAATVAPAAGAPVAAASAPPELLHRHGVELILKGSYPDMVAYMAALEGMQGQIFWGSAEMKVDTHPNATLTLVVYTISLDKKWLKL